MILFPNENISMASAGNSTVQPLAELEHRVMGVLWKKDDKDIHPPPGISVIRQEKEIEWEKFLSRCADEEVISKRPCGCYESLRAVSLRSGRYEKTPSLYTEGNYYLDWIDTSTNCIMRCLVWCTEHAKKE